MVQLSAQDPAQVAAAAREARLVPSHYVAKLAHYVAQLAQFENFDLRVFSGLAQVEVRATRGDLEFVARLNTPPFLSHFAIGVQIALQY